MNIIPATDFDGFKLKKGQLLVVYDIKGEQVADLCAFAAGDPTEWLSNGRTFDYEGTVFLRTGNVLFSNKSRPMFSIMEDTVGKHDFLYSPCSIEMYQIQYGYDGEHPNCLSNLTTAFKKLGLGSVEIPTPFNVFMNVAISETAQLTVKRPKSKSGDHIKLRAEMDLSVAMSACPSGVCNGGTQKPIGYEIVG